MKDYAVHFSHVTKKFDDAIILHDLEIHIYQNTKLAILGHNGSGKSSLLKLIAGIYRPTSGEINTFGGKIGYVPEHFPENNRFRLGEYLLHLGMIASTDVKIVKEKIAYYSQLFQLESHMETLLKDCSKGTKQKAGIIQALLNDCDILLLDEPITGLDEDSKKVFLQLMNEMDRDLTIIFTAHEQETVDLLAEEVLILENGKVVKHEAITEKTRMKNITVQLSEVELAEEVKVYGQLKHLHNSVYELIVPARESDRCLLYLLENNCSIIEVKEKI